MDSGEGYLLIAVTTIVLFAFVFSFLIVMLIYRRRKVEHHREVESMNEKFARELLQTQVEVQKDTMQYIGREIHDNIGQKLTLAALYAQQIDYENQYPHISGRVVAVSHIINESLQELRSLAKSLTSDYVSQWDLCTLISNECRRVEASGACTVRFTSSPGPASVSYTTKSIALRIVQECFQNSLKHAACSLITVGMKAGDGRICISFTDNGRGFSPEGQGSTGIGLSSMRKRAEMISADLQVNSILGGGTSILLLIPFSYQI